MHRPGKMLPPKSLMLLPFLLLLLVGASVFFSRPALAAEALLQDRIAAVVNDEVITLYELEAAFAPYRQAIAEKLTGKEATAEVEKGKKVLLGRLVDELLLEQEAVRLSLNASDAEVERQVQAILSQRRLSMEDFRQELAKEAMTLPQYRQIMKKEISKRRVIEREIVPRITVSDEEVGAFYAENRGAYEAREAVRLQQIMLPLEAGGGQAVQAKMLEIVGLLKNGEQFEALAAKYSQGAGASEGGNIGFVEKGSLLPELEEIIFALAVGGISNVIKTPAGFYLFKVTEKREGEMPLPSIREDIERKIRAGKINAKIGEYLETLRKKAIVQIKI